MPTKTPTPKPKQTPIRKQDPINPSPPVVQGYNYHTFWQWDAQYYNAFVQVNDSGLSVDSLDPNAFITNEEWRNDGSGDTGYWQEVGYVAGQLNVNGENQYYTGIFGASNEPSSGYMEFPITTNPQPYTSGQYGAWVALSVQTANPSLINIMYNNATYATVQAVASYSGDMQVGMESNSSNPAWNPFYQEIDLVGPQIYTGSWQFWPANSSSLDFYDDSPGDSAVCGWISSDPQYNPNEPHAACNYGG